MTGTIKTFIESKGYGFIKGKNGKNYFFHVSNIDKQDNIGEDILVSFEEEVSPKGYVAKKIKIDTSVRKMKYIVPDKIYISKDNNIKGWETIEKTSWLITGTSRDSPDFAKEDMMKKSESFKVNALLNVRYWKSTGSETSDSGQGTYKYTIHHYSGIPSIIGKKNINGTVEEFIKLDNFLRDSKELMTKKIIKITFIIFLVLSILVIIIGNHYNFSVKEISYIILGLSMVMLYMGYSNRVDWLEKRL